MPPIDLDWDLTVQDTKAKLDAGDDFLLLDVRTPPERATCAIEPSELLPMQEIAQRVDELEPFKDKPIIVYCHHGGRSLRVTQFLRQQGFADVMNMAGGIDKWAIEIEPGMTRY